MGLEMVLNDLSLSPSAKDIYAARQRMSTFIETFVVAVSLKVERTLRTADDMNEIELAAGYKVFQWRNDSDVSREHRTYLRTIATNIHICDFARMFLSSYKRFCMEIYV